MKNGNGPGAQTERPGAVRPVSNELGGNDSPAALLSPLDLAVPFSN
jgi:hypothetical protein